MRSDAAHRAVPDRRIFQAVDDLARFGSAINMRHDNPERAIVEGAGRDRVFAIGDARDRRDASSAAGEICAQASGDMTPCSISRNSQSKPATAMAFAISTLRVMRMPTPNASCPCSSFSRATLRTALIGGSLKSGAVGVDAVSRVIGQAVVPTLAGRE